jgi:hypothetical protein
MNYGFKGIQEELRGMPGSGNPALDLGLLLNPLNLCHLVGTAFIFLSSGKSMLIFL